MKINFIQTFYYGIIIKFYKILGLNPADVSPEIIKKIEAFAESPETKAAFKRIFQSYINYNQDIINDTVQRIVTIAQQTAKKSGQSLSVVLFEIFIPILGPLFAGINSLGNTVTNAMEGVSSATDIFADTFKKIADESGNAMNNQTNIKIAPTQMKGGFLVRQRTRKRTRRQQGGGGIETNDIQKAIQEILKTTSDI
jgi:hypothetical protein